VDLASLVAVEYLLSPPTIWLHWEQAVGCGSGFAGSRGSGLAGSMLVAVEYSLSPLTIWLRWEHGGSSGPGFAGSKLVAVDWASLVGVKVASLGASWKRWIVLRWLECII